MEHAKVAIFEDSELIQDSLSLLLSLENHETVIKARTLQEAEAAINDLEESTIDVAIVDGNLSPGASDCREGAYITRLLHEKIRSVVVISYSGQSDIEGADIQYGKHLSTDGLLSIIRQI